ncbi:MAG TPA: hypothetical protein VIM14_03615 [Polyangia bacterium]
MKTNIPKTVALGELILAVFDKAAEYSADPQEVSRLATQAISHMLWHSPRLNTSSSNPSTVS